MEREPTPIVRLPATTGDIELNWYNSLARYFDDSQYNHIEHYEEIDGVEKIRGLRVSQYVLDLLMENDFNYRFDKYPDEATMEWFVKSEVMIMENEIENLPDM